MSRTLGRDGPRVFISFAHAQRDDARRLVAVLDDLGYESQLDPSPGSLVVRSALRALRSVDVVVALLGSGDVAPNVAYELGLARGLGKPALVVVAPAGSVPSLDLAETQVVRADPTNRYALGLALERAVSTEPLEREEPEPERRSRPLGVAADRLLERAKAASTEVHAVEVLADALGHSRVTASVDAVLRVSASLPHAYRPDVAAWIEEARDSLGNPVIFEIAAHLTPRKVEQVRTYMDVAHARTGVVVWLDDSDPAVLWFGETSRVVGASLVWLIEQMRNQPIPAVLELLARS